jgi:hypothetical protein
MGNTNFVETQIEELRIGNKKIMAKNINIDLQEMGFEASR